MNKAIDYTQLTDEEIEDLFWEEANEKLSKSPLGCMVSFGGAIVQMLDENGCPLFGSDFSEDYIDEQLKKRYENGFTELPVIEHNGVNIYRTQINKEPKGEINSEDWAKQVQKNYLENLKYSQQINPIASTAKFHQKEISEDLKKQIEKDNLEYLKWKKKNFPVEFSQYKLPAIRNICLYFSRLCHNLVKIFQHSSS